MTMPKEHEQQLPVDESRLGDDLPDLVRIKQGKTMDELLHFSILNIDKPSGPTSYRTGERVQEAIGAEKMAHFGTLDPKVTGVLPVALNRACKLTRWFLHKEKTYVGVMRVHEDVSDETLDQHMRDFVGVIEQVPPVRSSVKREAREREVYSWERLGRDGRDVHFRARVEAGTYIRKLIHDMGERIGGAHMLKLRRTRAGIFAEDQPSLRSPARIERAAEDYANGDERFLREALIPGEAIGYIMPVLRVSANRLEQLLNGSPLYVEDTGGPVDHPAGTDVAVFADGRFVEVARTVDNEEEERMVAKPEFVFT